MLPAAGFITEPISDADPASGFACGEPELDTFFARHALANDRRGIGRTFVLRRSAADRPGLPDVLGFYTLSMADIEGRRLPRRLRGKDVPKYRLPVALVGRLAVDARAQGLGLGEKLLADSLARVLVAAEFVACVGVIVDAKTANAERFYAKYGFVTLDPRAQFPRRMFVTIATIATATR